MRPTTRDYLRLPQTYLTPSASGVNVRALRPVWSPVSRCLGAPAASLSVRTVPSRSPAARAPKSRQMSNICECVHCAGPINAPLSPALISRHTASEERGPKYLSKPCSAAAETRIDLIQFHTMLGPPQNMLLAMSPRHCRLLLKITYRKMNVTSFHACANIYLRCIRERYTTFISIHVCIFTHQIYIIPLEIIFPGMRF